MNDTDLDKLYKRIDSYKDEILKSLGDMIKIPAISPKSGGTGEKTKADFIMNLISNFGFDDIEKIDVPDESVPDKVRPNIIAKVRGEKDPSEGIFWVVTHTDVVPEGEMTLWETPPYEPTIKDGKIIGRGVEDNGQSLVASLYAVKALKEEGIIPKRSIGIALVADEEMGSEFGITPLIEKGLFSNNDMIVVPDSGNSEGTIMEVSEKSIMWLKIKAIGKQCHASLPYRGINAHRAAQKLGVKLDEELHRIYDKKDELFDPPESTFEPTKKESNVPNVNTIPGDDIMYFDCRVLPDYDLKEVLSTVETIAKSIEDETGAKFEFETPQFEQAAPPTSPTAPVVLALKEAIKSVYNNEPYAGGIGVGTCAALFRRSGYEAVVWAKIDEVAHSPNEYAWIDNIIGDTKVYATLFCRE
jgi:succinyl-diaminopimelate desuccinylase